MFHDVRRRRRNLQESQRAKSIESLTEAIKNLKAGALDETTERQLKALQDRLDTLLGIAPAPTPTPEPQPSAAADDGATTDDLLDLL